ncbi:D-TA family PLP-dependent enzyme [Aurantibacter crassamenti]|uniref:D-TA family PLP-dependent enzyme n=1 Tax=Aurantibacter crassamenti TaxID=1837375 RepID=UPI001939D769|nr:D-TA family PLP-dependent enzyme [Aurantibacter crassamenti]MBM1104770.1 D-TA family PLP-dependent enzyme [Aurantibacter crassamenti]
MSNEKWYALNEVENVVSPSLLVYPERVANNIQLMIELAGDKQLLRPHVKTHKTAEIIKMQMAQGINKFKCATIAEAELLAKCGAHDILLAMPIVGANIRRFLNLMNKYENSKFSTLVDNLNTLEEISKIAAAEKKIFALWMDINVGMNRTGILPNHDAIELFETIHNHTFTEAKGFHVYDGHIRETDIKQRKKLCDAAFEKVLSFKKDLEGKGINVENIVAGGSPTFPIHSQREGIETSPGTTLLWDAGYAALFPELQFQKAAILFMRIISKPSPNIICLDLGHKMLASEMSFPRVHIFGLEDSKQIGQSEEHLVIETTNAENYNVGDVFYGVPMHICPTVAKYENLLTVENGSVTGKWNVAARNQKITI